MPSSMNSILPLNPESSENLINGSTSDCNPQSELDSFRNNWIHEVQRRHRQHNQSDGLKADPSVLASSGQHPVQAVLREQPNPQTPREDPLVIYAHAVYYERTGLLDDALLCYRKAFRLEVEVDRAYHLLKPHEIDAIERNLDPNRLQDQLSPGPSYTFSRAIHSVDEHNMAMDFDQAQGDSNATPKKSARPPGFCLPTWPDQGQLHNDHPSSTDKLLESLVSSFAANPWTRTPPTIDSEDGTEELADDSELSIQVNNTTTLLSEKFGALGIDNTDSTPISLVFEPMDLALPCHIQFLPSEILMHIFGVRNVDRASVHLLVHSIERFACVSRFARILTLDQSLWRVVCETTFGNDLFVNQKSAGLDEKLRLKFVEDLCRKSHGNDWRRMYIEQQRIRVDGCFIALIRYPRLGESANPWYTPTHFVTYFRYLRLFANGTCLSLTSTDEPNVVVRKLQWPSSATQLSNGVLCGHWSLNDDFVRVYDLQQDSRHLWADGRGTLRIANEGSRSNYRFEMHCRLQSTRRGKMNKLDIIKLSTLNLNSGEELEIPLSTSENGSKPFIFSRVVAYDL